MTWNLDVQNWTTDLELRISQVKSTILCASNSYKSCWPTWATFAHDPCYCNCHRSQRCLSRQPFLPYLMSYSCDKSTLSTALCNCRLLRQWIALTQLGKIEMICKRKRIIGKVNFLCENAFKAKIVTGDYKDKQVLA